MKTNEKIELLKECLHVLNSIKREKYFYQQADTNTYDLASRISKILKDGKL